jgi:UDP-N-acetylglucosamine 2-epimerase (non-hydrolysing)
MYKILTLVGTRPELIKMCRVINALDKNFNHILVHSGQNYDYELNKIFFKNLKIRKPDYFLNVKDKKLSKLIGNIIEKSDYILEKEKPDALLIYGDTNTSLAIMSAKRRKIPIFHMEAGNRCFDQRVPEEINRKIADHLSDINLVLTEQARQNLLQEGIKSNTIFKTGSHMKEVLDYYKKDILNSKILKKINLKPRNYFLASLHREENVDDKDNLKLLINSLVDLSNKFKKIIILSTHPRTRVKLKKDKLLNNKNILFFKPFGFFDYNFLQINSFCTISDSGTIFEEAYLLHFPAVTIRNSHERPEGIESGSVVASSLNSKNIISSVNIAIKNYEPNQKTSVYDYNVDLVSKKIVKIVSGYISVINQKVWYKK